MPINGTTVGQGAFLDGLQSFFTRIGQAMPDILAALLILIIGILVAGLLGRLAKKLVIWSQVDNLLTKSRVSVGEEGTRMKFRIADVVGPLVQWSVILLSIAIVADILNWEPVTNLVNNFIAYIPNIVAAAIIMIGGYLLGNFIATLVSGMSDTLGRTTSTVANVARWMVIVFAAMAALIELGIAQSIILIAFTGLTAMVAIAGGLAFGLGGRDKAHDLFSNVNTNSIAQGS